MVVPIWLLLVLCHGAFSAVKTPRQSQYDYTSTGTQSIASTDENLGYTGTETKNNQGHHQNREFGATDENPGYTNIKNNRNQYKSPTDENLGYTETKNNQGHYQNHKFGAIDEHPGYTDFKNSGNQYKSPTDENLGYTGTETKNNQGHYQNHKYGATDEHPGYTDIKNSGNQYKSPTDRNQRYYETKNEESSDKSSTDESQGYYETKNKGDQYKSTDINGTAAPDVQDQITAADFQQPPDKIEQTVISTDESSVSTKTKNDWDHYNPSEVDVTAVPETQVEISENPGNDVQRPLDTGEHDVYPEEPSSPGHHGDVPITSHCVLLPIENAEIEPKKPLYSKGDTVDITCEAGFHFKNLRLFHLLCMDDGQWDTKIPTCVAVTCIFPLYLENGQWTIENDNGQKTGLQLPFGTRVSYNCNSGYELDGPKDRWCQSEGWTDEEPVCKEITCEDLPEIKNGQPVGVTGVYLPGHEVEIKCDLGFKPAIDNRAYLACSSTGTWETAHSKCRSVRCDTPTEPANGWFKQEGYERFQKKAVYDFTDKIMFGCNSGYALVGKKSISCRENGWTDDFPTCTEVNCPRPPEPPNGWIVGNEKKKEFSPGEIVSYQCEDWYELIGSPQRICNEKGWSGTPVECRLKGCPPPSKMSNMQLSLQKAFISFQETSSRFVPFFGTLFTKCSEGYKSNGNHQAVCKRDGQWSIPRCIQIRCRAPYQISNGYTEGISASREYYYYNHQVVHRCYPGYILVGTAVRHCRENGWTDKLPRCEIPTCPKPYIVNGMAVQMNEPWPVNIGGTAEVKCNEGYKLLGLSSVIECRGNERWNSSLNNLCTAVTCPKPYIPNGFVTTRTRSGLLYYNETAQITCNPGYRLRDGIDVVQCTREEWNDFSNKCTDEKYCSGPSFVRDGKVQQHILQALTQDPQFRNGKTLPVDFRMAYECNPGFRMIGDPETVCTEQGWSGNPPTCSQISCPKPEIRNGLVSAVQGYWSYRPNGKIKIHCYNGYVLIDDRPIIECNQDGQWNDTLDKCADKQSCPNPGVIENGRIKNYIWYNGKPSARLPVNTQIIYECIPGYRMIGESGIICTKSGWSANPPICEEFLCDPPENPEHGMLLGIGPFRLHSNAEFKCFFGYYPYPLEANLTCTERGWTGQIPQCRERYCPSLSKVEHGYFHNQKNPILIEGVYKWPLGSNLQYSCEDPYKMNGEPEIRCLPSGQWSSDPPVCEAAYCTKPNVEHSVVPRSHFRYQPDEKFEVQCLPGHRLNDTSELVCMKDGSWAPSSVACQEILCWPPPPLLFGKVGPEKAYYRFGEKVKYVCGGPTVELKGERERACTESGWSEQAPICAAKRIRRCSSPLLMGLKYELHFRPDQKSDESFNIGDSVVVECPSGFQPMGNPLDNRIVCTPHGNWSTDVVNCTESFETSCPAPPSIVNGKLMNRKENYRIGETVTISCNRGFRLDNGTDVMTCLPGGKWEEEFAECKKVWCSAPQAPVNGLVENVDSNPNGSWPFYSEAIFVCKPGYQLHGNHWIKCLQNGWSGSPPTCKEISCADPGTPEEGWKNVESLTVGSKVQFECFSGYQLIGPKERICLKNGLWSDEQPYCHSGKSSCPGLPVPTGALKSGTYYNEGGQVSFACTSGYTFVGSQSRTCHNGTWTGTDSYCIGKNEFHIPEDISYQLQTSIMGLESSSHETTLPQQNHKVSGSLVVRPEHIVVYFILDATTSIGRANFEIEREFAKAVIKKLNISTCGIRVGVITLSSQAVIEFYPNDFHSQYNVLKALDDIVYREGSTSLQAALEILSDMMKETQDTLGGVAKSHIYLLTNGKLNAGLNPLGVAKRIKEHFQTSFTCLSLTGQWRKQILYSIATDKDHIFFLDSFSTLHWLSNQITKETIDYSKCGRGLNQQTQPAYLEHLGLDKSNKTLPWPWTVFISYQGSSICRGSLINSEWVLTSAWCVTSCNGTLTPGDFSLDIGFISSSLSAKAIYHHPLYNATDMTYNAALIQLKEPVVFSEAVRPICLPLSLQNNTLYKPGEYGYVSTWGEKNSGGKYPLHHVSIPVQRTNACNKAQGEKVTLHNSVFCAGNGEVKLTAENSDHGGPLIQYQLDSDGQPVWIQIGIASLPTHHLYNYFTNVSEVLNWIRAFVPV